MSLETDPFILDLKAKIKSEIEQLSYFVSRGKCSGFESYMQATGMIEGLSRSIDIIGECMKNYTRDDDED